MVCDSSLWTLAGLTSSNSLSMGSHFLEACVDGNDWRSKAPSSDFDAGHRPGLGQVGVRRGLSGASLLRCIFSAAVYPLSIAV
jgi:hypothetical protein